MIQLRDYQSECIELIDALPDGRYLIQMATGLGKTVTFANIKRRGRMLILSHREELVRQPLKYFGCPTGVEMASETSHGEDVVSASVQSLARRLGRFKPDDFEIIIVDEAHHAAAGTYKKILAHFKPHKVLGFTATPNRADKARLNDVFDKIIFKRDLRWGIKQGYLCDINCLRADIGYDLSAVHTRMGDYAPGELAAAMDGTADAVAEAYRDYAHGATLIFAVNVDQAYKIAERIDGAEVVTGETKDRADIISRFTRREIPCIVNVMVFTEGTDIPLVETVIIARPTQSDSLYTQMVGRGLRLHPDKDKLTLIDCVGVTGKAHLCTAPSLLGIDLSSVPKSKQAELVGDLFELPGKAEAASDCPESWIKNIRYVNLWAQEQSYNLHDVNYFKMPDGSMTVSLPNKVRIEISAADELGRAMYDGQLMDMQDILDMIYETLCNDYPDSRAIWDLNAVKRWGSAPATEAQIRLINRRCKGFDAENLTKAEASQILNRVMGGSKK